MAKIQKIIAREILDSRGNPTIETAVYLEGGWKGTASVPSGASVGSYEVLELRDNDPSRYQGMGVLRAVKNVNDFLASKLLNFDASNQREIDNQLLAFDNTPNKSILGGNTLLSISLAITKASSESLKLPLYVYLNNLAKSFGIQATPSVPTPIFNLINGGKHGAGNLNFQEFHLIPAAFKSFKEKLQIGTEIYHALKKSLIYRNAIHSVGDEGGFAPNLFTNMDALELIKEAVKTTFYVLGRNVFLGLDVAATHFKTNQGYSIKDKQECLSTDGLIDYYLELNNIYHLILLEDALEENDWKGWAKLMIKLGGSMLIVADDLTVTNTERLQKAIAGKAANAIIIKPNQIGTLTETFQVISLAKSAGLKTILSHRSGETTDTFIADLAVAVAADYVKFGAPCRGERVVKYNRLAQIEDELTGNSI